MEEQIGNIYNKDEEVSGSTVYNLNIGVESDNTPVNIGTGGARIINYGNSDATIDINVIKHSTICTKANTEYNDQITIDLSNDYTIPLEYIRKSILFNSYAANKIVTFPTASDIINELNLTAGDRFIQKIRVLLSNFIFASSTGITIKYGIGSSSTISAGYVTNLTYCVISSSQIWILVDVYD